MSIVSPTHIKLAILIAFAAAAVALTCASNVRADAWVERMLDKKEHDFGVIASGTKAICRFSVTNVYKHRVTLDGVRSSCGCTAHSLENKRLDPGQTGYIVANLNTRGMTGALSSALTLDASWDDNGVDRKGQATVTVAGTIRDIVRAEPSEIDFPNVRHGTAAEQIVRISAERAAHWAVESVQCSCDNLGVELPQPTLSPQLITYKMLVRLGPKTPLGFIREQITIVPSNKAEPQIPLYVSGRVVPDMWVAPEALFLGEVAVGERVSKKVVVRRRQPSRIISVRSDEEVIDFRTKDSTAKWQILEIEVPAGSQVGALKKSITITSDSGKTAYVTAYANVVALPSASAPHGN